jgi:hypothetical protein
LLKRWRRWDTWRAVGHFWEVRVVVVDDDEGGDWDWDDESAGVLESSVLMAMPWRSARLRCPVAVFVSILLLLFFFFLVSTDIEV